ncbi:MAG: hypothetical protein NC122_10955 [Faecalibacterium sp.]|nr:hypothetical protein [Faecalibacterium sp.]
MGTWGTGLYSNDVAEDVREACKDIYAFLDADSGNEKIFDIFMEYVFEPNGYSDIDNDTASFWYALADWQWNHGILSSEVKKHTISMLNEYAGLSEWTVTSDIKKRKAVMDTLKLKLESEQPSKKLPRVKPKKAKHDPGDIIIFKTCQNSDDEYNNLWMIENLTPPLIFKSEKLSHSRYENIPAHDAHGKYMAVLCIGKEKIKHSEYLSNVFDEYSIYVWYDYESSEKPTLEQLQRCGFLPHIRLEYSDYNSLTVESVGWEYAFILMSESFKSSKNCYKLSDAERKINEVKRFEHAAISKGYLNTVSGFAELYSAYLTCWQEKIRTAPLGLSIDTLLNDDVSNPELLPIDAINDAYKKWMLSLTD